MGHIKLTLEQEQLVCKMYLEGNTCKNIANSTGIDDSAIWRSLHRNKIQMQSSATTGEYNIIHGLGKEAKELGLHQRVYIRFIAVEKLGGKCSQCGELDLKVLQINHLNEKNGNIKQSELMDIINNTYTGPNIDIRCANCNVRYEYEKGKRKQPPFESSTKLQDKLAQPVIFHIAQTGFDWKEAMRFLNDLGIETWTPTSDSDGEILAEFAGRLCYQAWEAQTINKNVTKVREDSKVYLENILNSGHGSVLEHVSDTYVIYCSRVCANEIVRHRHASYSQESLRYVRLTNLKLYYPDIFKNNENSKDLESLFLNKISQDEKLIEGLNEKLNLDNLSSFDKKKKLTSAIRRLAPMGLMTYISMTSNIRNWRHTIELRTSKHAEEEVRKVFGLIYKDQKERYPFFYQDSIEEEVDGLLEVKFKNSKV